MNLQKTVLDDPREPDYPVGSLHDYAAQLSARDELEVTHDAILVRDLAGEIVFWNRAAEELYGWSRDEIPGRTTNELLQTRFPEPLEQILAELNQSGRWEGELIHARKDGTLLTVASRWMLQTLADGTPLGILEMNYDLTSRKRAEEQLRAQTATLELAHTLVRDMSSRIVLWNRGAERLYGFSRDEALGKISHELFRTQFPEPPSVIEAKLERAGEWEGELIHTKRDGTEMVVASHQVIYRDERGMPTAILETNNDITAQKHAEEQIRQNARRARMLSEISKALASVNTDYGTVLSTLVEQVTELIGDRVGLALISEDRMWLDVIDSQGIEPELAEISQELIPSGHYPLNLIPDWAALEHGQAILVPEVDQQALRARTKPEHLQYLDRFGTYSRLTVPMRVQGTVIGALGVTRARPGHPYTLEDQDFLQEIADRAALAITNARLLETAQEELARRKMAEEEIRMLNAALEARVAERTAQLAETNAKLLQEIGERARAEESLARERDLLHALMDNIPDTIYFKDTAFRFTRINVAAAQVIGVETPEQAYGKTDYDWQPVELAESSIAEEREILQSRQPLIDRIEYNPKRDGTPRWFSATKAPIIDKAGHVLGIAGISRDITRRMLAEQQVKRLNMELELRALELERANQELEAFSYSVSHDLRAPLRAIDGYSRILQEDYDALLDDEGRRVSGVIRSEAQRMSQLIDDLLELSRLGRREMQESEIDMAAMARRVFAELTATDKSGGITFTLGSLPSEQGDPTLLYQVWINLLSNAIKFTAKRECPQIQVDGSRTETETIYAVHDNGAGFDMKYYNKLFGVFQRLHNDRDFGGTGVGLAIVQRAVRRHGGRVWAEGQVNEGATFYFALPHHQEGA